MEFLAPLNMTFAGDEVTGRRYPEKPRGLQVKTGKKEEKEEARYNRASSFCLSSSPWCAYAVTKAL